MSITYAQMLTFISLLMLVGCNRNLQLQDYKDFSFSRSIKVVLPKKEKAFLSFEISKKGLGFAKLIDAIFSERYLLILTEDTLSIFNFSCKKILDSILSDIGFYKKIFSSGKEVLLTSETSADLFELDGKKLEKKLTFKVENDIFKAFLLKDSVVIVSKNGHISWFNRKGEKFAEITLNLLFSTLGCSIDDEENILISNSDSFYKFKDGKIIEIIQLNNIGKPSGVILQSEVERFIAKKRINKTTCIFSKNSLLISNNEGKNFKRYDSENRSFSLFEDQICIVSKNHFLKGTLRGLYENKGLERIEFRGAFKHVGEDLFILNGALVYCGKTIAEKVDFAKMKEVWYSVSEGTVERQNLIFSQENGKIFLYTMKEKCVR